MLTSAGPCRPALLLLLVLLHWAAVTAVVDITAQHCVWRVTQRAAPAEGDVDDSLWRDVNSVEVGFRRVLAHVHAQLTRLRLTAPSSPKRHVSQSRDRR